MGPFADRHPYTAFKDHSTGKNNNTEVVVLEAVRAAHPESQVIPVYAGSCDFLGWTAAGHAHMELVKNGTNFVTRRRYIASKSRLDRTQGKLDNVVTFGEYALNYQGREVQLYLAEWPYDMIGRRTVKMFYIVTDGTDSSEGGSSWADDLLLAIGQWTAELHEEVYVFDNGQWEKDENLYAAIQSSRWDDVILDSAMKHSMIDDLVGFFRNQSVYQRYAVPWKRGIIFHGPPGCGKTMSIKALMKSLIESNSFVAPLLVKRLDSSCSDAQDGVRSIFGHARAMAPCLLVFEDLDSLVVDKVRSYFLNEVDGLQDNDGILMIGSTNHLERLDPAITKRPSRFDRKYHFELPAEKERARYCEYWMSKLECELGDNPIDYAMCEAVARITNGFSFAYLKELMMQGLLSLARISESDNTEAKGTKHEGVLVSSWPHRNHNSENAVVGTSDTSEDSTLLEILRDGVPARLLTSPLMHILCNQVIALRQDIESLDAEKPRR